ncbi:MAG TPA: hypothetical protein V6C52_02065 [Coleofasciculaceae cyanobacterium]|jgi:hypothetical protein
MAGSINGNFCGSAHENAGYLKGQQVQYKPEARSGFESLLGQAGARYNEDMTRLDKLPKGEQLTVLEDVAGPEDSLFPARTLMVQDSDFHGYTIPACVADIAKQK